MFVGGAIGVGGSLTCGVDRTLEEVGGAIVILHSVQFLILGSFRESGRILPHEIYLAHWYSF